MSATHGRRARRAERDANRPLAADESRADDAGTTAFADPSGADTALGSDARRARAGLPVRIMLGALAALALAVTVLAAVNLRAVTAFNQATSSLHEHIAAARSDTPDWSKLSAVQEQTDAQFDEAEAADAVLLPGIRESIAANAAVSDQLTALVKQHLAAQQGGDGNAGDNGAAGTDKQGQSSDSSGALTDEQRKQVEDLLKANEQSTPSDKGKGTSKESTVTNNTGNTNKPW
ncbi:cell surface protein [Bifidobacterium sp. 82T10]|uniref:Cell surface protein n=1 Tax=Bifidobacterium miconis TaxID=2834435 RepID=A0ABS6WE29_9BIFI|nr:DUF6466 family protein [Bifidobacterium miconis]MBW3091567.1 cell surface protein [Bifidobacterium miconis]